MIETYRMLGREHEADLAREATRRRQASLVRPATRSVGASVGSGRSRVDHNSVWARLHHRARRRFAFGHCE
jgi:hypothetical protein